LIQPTILPDTTPEMGIFQEDIFGPVGLVMRLKDDDDAMRQANAHTGMLLSPRPLPGYIVN